MYTPNPKHSDTNDTKPPITGINLRTYITNIEIIKIRYLLETLSFKIQLPTKYAVGITDI